MYTTISFLSREFRQELKLSAAFFLSFDPSIVFKHLWLPPNRCVTYKEESKREFEYYVVAGQSCANFSRRICKSRSTSQLLVAYLGVDAQRKWRGRRSRYLVT